MNFAVIAIATASLLLSAAFTAVPAQAGRSHQHPAAAIAAGTPAQRWDSDVPLRTGMAKIRSAVDALDHYEHGHMGPEQAATLASHIQKHITDLVANNKLQPQADTALHLIIAEVAAGAQALKASPTDLAAIAAMRQALAQYPRQFRDPTWLPVEPEAVR